mmetsp:Transcript_31768/g.48756  ORF Transcript_31768/g.48756 Transcript_31768/m.48756 type:complete len:81 (+) Transcript_31768:1517-1759(+)
MKKQLGGLYSEVPGFEKVLDHEEEEDDDNLVNKFNNDEVTHTVTETKNGKIIFTKIGCESKSKARMRKTTQTDIVEPSES